jgi:hypothetical protein
MNFYQIPTRIYHKEFDISNTLICVRMIITMLRNVSLTQEESTWSGNPRIMFKNSRDVANLYLCFRLLQLKTIYACIQE